MEVRSVGGHQEDVMAGPPKSWIQAMRGSSLPPCSWSGVLPTFPTVGAVLKDTALREYGVVETIWMVDVTEPR